jgi:hypothetical protein
MVGGVNSVCVCVFREVMYCVILCELKLYIGSGLILV